MASIHKQSKATQEKHRKILGEMLRRPENRQCIDCRAANPSWASINIGCFLCIRCSGLHRQIGVHISQVRSTTMDIWQPEQIAFMQTMGNANVKAIWEATLPKDYGKPSEDEDSAMVMQWIRTKYERKKYFSATGRAPGGGGAAPETTTTPTAPAVGTKKVGRKKAAGAKGGIFGESPCTSVSGTSGAGTIADGAVQPPQPQQAKQQATGWDPSSASYLGGGFDDLTISNRGFSGVPNTTTTTTSTIGGFSTTTTTTGASGFGDNGGGFGFINDDDSSNPTTTTGGASGQNHNFSEFVSFSPVAASPQPEGASGGWGGFTVENCTQQQRRTQNNVDHSMPSLFGGTLAPGQQLGGGQDGFASPSSMYVEGGGHSRAPSNSGVVFDPFDTNTPQTMSPVPAPCNTFQPQPPSMDSPVGSTESFTGGAMLGAEEEVNPSGGSAMMMQMMLQQQQQLVQMQMQQAAVVQAGGTPSPQFAAMLEAAQIQFNAMMATMTAGAPQSPVSEGSPTVTAQANGGAFESQQPQQPTVVAGGGGGFGRAPAEASGFNF